MHGLGDNHGAWMAKMRRVLFAFRNGEHSLMTVSY
jgi:hypothetical protein